MAFTAQDVKKLREMTNCGMMDCKKALTEADGDFDKAIEWLRGEGQGRFRQEGRQGGRRGRLPTPPSSTVWVLSLRSTPQTDFVAKNEVFQGFVKDLATVVAEQAPADVEALKACTYPGTDRTVADVTNDRVLSIGENLQIRRFVRYAEGVNVPLYPHGRQGRRAGEPGGLRHRGYRRCGGAGQGCGHADCRYEPRLCLQR